MSEKPDIMNDAAFDTNVADKEKTIEDPDTCRICRAEGTKEEPLFYPCKCSGSIKFVHQNCLMEWLSHSQKKHCELCKVSFRFTKLYAQNMPNTVPLTVFLRQAAVHTYRSLRSLCRFLIVFFVWMAWLPWSMRSIWRYLFWFGDGAWVEWEQADRRAIAAAQAQIEKLAAEGTSPAGLNFFSSKDNAASALVSHMANAIPQMLTNYRNGPPLYRLGRRLLRAVISKSANQTGAVVPPPLSSNNYTAPADRATLSPSLLSNATYLNSLTRSPRINHIVVDVLEGQLITLCVVILFILTFLIREWVVQQQPGLNAAAAARREDREARDLPALQQLARQHAERHLPPVQETGQAAEHRAEAPAVAEGGPPGASAIAGQRAGFAPEDEATPGSMAKDLNFMASSQFDETTQGLAGFEESSPAWFVETDTNVPIPVQRPRMPPRAALRQAAEIRRVLEEQARASGQEDWPGLKIFTDLWTRSLHQPSEVINIIEREGKTQELGWIVTFMKRLDKMSSSDRNSNAEGHQAGSTTGEPSSDSHRSSANRILPFANEIMQKPTVVLPNNMSDNFWSSPDIKTPNSDEENRSISGSSPVLNQKDGYQTNFLEDEPLGLRDISNRQNVLLRGRPRAVGVVRDGEQIESDGEFVVVGGQVSNGNSPYSSPLSTPLSTPQTLAINNPFHPDYMDDDSSDSVETHDPTDRDGAVQEVVEHLQGQEQNATRLLEASNAITRDGPSEDSENPMADDQDDSLSPSVPTPNAPRSYTDLAMDWLWGELSSTEPAQAQSADDEHRVENIDEEAPFVPVDHGHPVIEHADDQDEAEPRPDAEAFAAAIQAGLDPNDAEGVDDVEDLEGIMELVGMQGPMIGLLQNAMFCAVVVSLTMLLGIWIPYITGKCSLILMANPVSLLVKMPLRWSSNLADTIIDSFIFSAAWSFYSVDIIVRFLCRFVGLLFPSLGQFTQSGLLANVARGYAESALDRLLKGFMASSGSFFESDIPLFSIIAHEPLQDIQQWSTEMSRVALNNVVNVLNATSVAKLGHNLVEVGAAAKNSTELFTSNVVPSLETMVHSWTSINPLKIDLSIAERTRPVDYSLSTWGSKDRAIAILIGYLAFGLAGVAYLKISGSLRERNGAGKVEGPFADVLYQAAGVLKVVLIISIEMIAFPLFCGLLLDVALLPLFNHATLLSRLDFTLTSPWTSLFIHWFIGTCYMFHLALFVSMCRKLMRAGVLYFIRDPDDPTFHPVRDVLERNIVTQFRKIIFSAIVYGGLVLVCLGGVVWGLSYALEGIFPIHWSSNQPVLEFPVDLLFYNLLMPAAVKFFRPSKAVDETYKWWLRKCARVLRLSHFLFNDKREDEEGHQVYRTWKALFRGGDSDSSQVAVGEDQRLLAEDRDSETYFLRDGRYVRTPASDQVRMPKGARAFLDVDEDNNRIDGLADADTGTHGRTNDHFTKVYVPPSFRLRISVFISLIWLFTAVAGTGVTILPLMLGRYIFTKITPEHLQMNDVYSFSIGIYLLGGCVYLALNARRFFVDIRAALTPAPESTAATYIRLAKSYTALGLGFIYTYGAFIFFLSALFSLLVECYLVIPLHTYFAAPTEQHTVHVVQDWTLGVLWLKTFGRMILWNTPSRPANALRGIVHDGWLKPDVRLATRAFILPATVLAAVALLFPLSLGWIANVLYFHDDAGLLSSTIYRYSFPAVLAIGMLGVWVWLLRRVFEGWRRRIRDEVYLIGERLHNFGDSKRVKVGMKRAGRVATH